MFQKFKRLLFRWDTVSDNILVQTRTPHDITLETDVLYSEAYGQMSFNIQLKISNFNQLMLQPVLV